MNQAVRALATLKVADLATQLNLFSSLVRSVFLYGAEVWFPFCRADPEVLQNNFLRRIYGLPFTTSGAVLRREFNVLPIRILAWRQCLRFWIAILERPHLSLLQAAYATDCEHVANPTSWAGCIKRTLENSGFAYVWLAQDPELASRMLPEILLRLTDQIRQADLTCLETRPKNAHYRLVNKPGEAPSYWVFNLQFEIQRFMTQVRVAGIPLGWNKVRVLDLALVAECPLCRCVMRPKLSLFHLLCTCDAISLPPVPRVLEFLNTVEMDAFASWLQNPSKQEIIALYNRAQYAFASLWEVLVPKPS